MNTQINFSYNSSMKTRRKSHKSSSYLWLSEPVKELPYHLYFYKEYFKYLVFQGSITWIINPFLFSFNILPFEVVDSAHFSMVFIYHFEIIADHEDKLLSRKIAKKKRKINKRLKTKKN